ncbi:MAG: XRE family transcriptional regulator [Pseudomonadota bacterium]|nr:XRE family transcriptional regulator [Pseudomonadota bacterium]
MSTRQQIGKRVRRLRKGRDQTLAELARLSGVSVSTISKIENDALSPTLDVILKLCDGLAVDIGDLVSEGDGTQPDATPNSRFSVARKDSGVLFDTPNYDYLYLCPDVKRKQMVPILARVKARSMTEFGTLFSHGGEEFLFVLKGEINVHSAFYETVRLGQGDGVYLDSSMGHAYVSANGQDAEVLCICTEPKAQGEGAPAI